MDSITGVWVSHEVAKGWTLRVEVTTASPLESTLWLVHEGTRVSVERDAQGGPVCAGRPGWPSKMPTAARRAMMLVLESHEFGAEGEADAKECEALDAAPSVIHIAPHGHGATPRTSSPMLRSRA